jgi:protein TonB
MSEAILLAPEPSPRGSLLWIFLGVSIAVHGAVLVWLTITPSPPVRQKRVTELVMVEVERPPPPPAPEAKPEPPQPIPKEVRKLFSRSWTRGSWSSLRRTTRCRRRSLRAPAGGGGLTLRSTTTAGSFEAPVGNTLAGKPPDKAADPSSVKPSPVPLYELDSQPTVIGDVRIPYPEDARSRGIEGTVVLSVLVDETGQVRMVKLISGPGGGLDQAAAKAVERIRFRPALRKGQPVAAQITYRYTFLLD